MAALCIDDDPARQVDRGGPELEHPDSQHPVKHDVSIMSYYRVHAQGVQRLPETQIR